MCVRRRITLGRLLVYGFGGLCGVAIAQAILDGNVDWDSVRSMGAGWLLGLALLEAIAALVRHRRRRESHASSPADDGD